MQMTSGSIFLVAIFSLQLLTRLTDAPGLICRCKSSNMALRRTLLRISGICGAFLIIIILPSVECKMYTRCQLGQVLVDNNFKAEELGDWICLAEKCSMRNSSKTKTTPWSDNTNSTLYGMYQISNRVWCSDGTWDSENRCNMDCSRLITDDLTDTLECAREVSKESPDFMSWDQFKFCRTQDTRTYVKGCYLEGVQFSPDQKLKPFVLPVVISAGLLSVGIVTAFTVVLIRKYLQNQKLVDLWRKYALESTDITIDPSDPSNILGEGNFGIVHRGQYKNQNAAFKSMLDQRDNISLRYELKVFAALLDNNNEERHPNIVQLFGTYTDADDKLYLVVEECAYGSLESYLQRQQGACLAPALVPSSHNGNYQIPALMFQENDHVTRARMLSWSVQVAVAMEYLTQKHVIHADLATRNLLLKDPDTVKLTDFGLSKKMYTNLIYLRSKEKEVPWRWLPLEALIAKCYSTQSDVWSFGVTMWEIYSLAQLPYGNLSYLEYVKRLVSFEEAVLEQPFAASDEIYAIMCSCWARDQEERPSFTVLQEKLRSLLDQSSCHDTSIISIGFGSSDSDNWIIESSIDNEMNL